MPFLDLFYDGYFWLITTVKFIIPYTGADLGFSRGGGVGFQKKFEILSTFL